MDTISTRRPGAPRLRRSAARKPSGPLPGSIPEYDASLHTGSVVLEQLLEARQHVRTKHVLQDGAVGHEDTARVAAAQYLPLLWDSYEQSHGRILECYAAQNIAAGAVLTDKDELHVRYPTESVATITPAFERTLWSCCAQFREARDVLLPGGGRRILLTQMYSLLVYLLSVLDSQSAGGAAKVSEPRAHERITSALETADQQLRRTRVDLNQFAQRDGQQLYLLGMAPGIGLLLLLAFVTSRATIAGVEVQPLLVALAAGGVGAVLSVMTRIMGPTLRFDYHTGNVLIIAAGVFRPIIGGTFGVALVVLLHAGLVQVLRIPDAQAAQTYFFMALAFLAGFSERWAHDILLLAGGDRKNSPGADEDAETEPSGGRGRPTPVSPVVDPPSGRHKPGEDRTG